MHKSQVFRAGCAQVLDCNASLEWLAKPAAGAAGRWSLQTKSQMWHMQMKPVYIQVRLVVVVAVTTVDTAYRWSPVHEQLLGTALTPCVWCSGN